MYGVRSSGDALDSFLRNPAQTQSYSSYQAYPYSSPQASYYPMTAAVAPSYGQPGSFSGRKAMQAPGGNSSMNLGDGSGYSPYSRYGSYQGSAGAGISAGAAYGSPYGGQQAYSSGMYQQGADLSSQLNMPQQAMRRPPSSGRRAASQPSPYEASTSYGAAASYGAPGGMYGSMQQQQYGSNSNQQSYSQQSPSQYSYGASSAAYGSGQAGYGSSAYQPSSPTGAASYNAASIGYGSKSAYSSPAGYGAAQTYDSQPQYGGGYGSPTGAGSLNYLPTPAHMPVFHPGQKGQFCGKIIMQPPGGKTTLNIFG